MIDPDLMRDADTTSEGRAAVLAALALMALAFALGFVVGFVAGFV